MTAPKTTPTAKVCAEIKGGKHDDDLRLLVDAINNRIVAAKSKVRTYWVINIGGLEIAEDDLTLDESMLIEAEAGLTWAMLDNPSRSARVARAILLVCLQTRSGMTEDAAKEQVGKVTMADWADGVSTRSTTENPTQAP